MLVTGVCEAGFVGIIRVFVTRANGKIPVVSDIVICDHLTSSPQRNESNVSKPVNQSRVARPPSTPVVIDHL